VGRTRLKTSLMERERVPSRPKKKSAAVRPRVSAFLPRLQRNLVSSFLSLTHCTQHEMPPGNSSYLVGDRLSFPPNERCTVQYVGTVDGAEGQWLGVEWDNPTRGKHNGTLNGHEYFKCKSSLNVPMIMGSSSHFKHRFEPISNSGIFCTS